MKSSWVIKLNRANELIVELKREIEDRFQSTPPKVIFSKIEEPDIYSVIISELPKIEDRWSAIAGDVVHNLRSSLDSIIFSIITKRAIQSGRRINLHQIEYPITGDPNAVRNRTDWHQSEGTEELFQVIEGHLPNYEGLELSRERINLAIKNHSLIVLQRLSNNDKHHSTNVIMCALDYSGYELPEGVRVELINSKAGNVLVGDEIMQARITGVSDTKQPIPFTQFEIAFEGDIWEDGTHGVVARLEALSSLVQWNIQELVHFLD